MTQKQSNSVNGIFADSNSPKGSKECIFLRISICIEPEISVCIKPEISVPAILTKAQISFALIFISIGYVYIGK